MALFGRNRNDSADQPRSDAVDPDVRAADELDATPRHDEHDELATPRGDDPVVDADGRDGDPWRDGMREDDRFAAEGRTEDPYGLAAEDVRDEELNDDLREEAVVAGGRPDERRDGRRSLDEQRDFLLGKVGAVRPFAMNTQDVAGLVLCEDIDSDLDLPLVTTARVAGWGVRGDDLVGASTASPRALHLVGHVRAADGPGRRLVSGAAVQIDEGAIVPDGVDAIIPADAAHEEDGRLVVDREVRLYDNLRRAGSDLSDGTPLLRAGDVLTPRSVAVLSEIGLDKVLVRPRPRVGVFTVGETLVAPGQALTQPQQRYDAVTALIAASARQDGATVYPLGIVANTEEAIREVLADQQIRADLVIAIGGDDAVRRVVADLGDVDEAEVAVNRSSRVVFAEMGRERTPLVILPAGAVSAFTAYHALVRPVLNKMNQLDPLHANRVQGRLVERIDTEAGATQFVPGVRTEDGAVRAVGAPDSELAWDLARANVLVVVPEDWAGADAGSTVECIVLDDVRVAAADRR